MSVEIKSPGISNSTSATKSFGGISPSMSKEGGRGSNYKPMFSISKEGSMTKLGETMKTPKITIPNKIGSASSFETKSSYRPLFSISKEGKLSTLGTISKSSQETKSESQPLVPVRGGHSQFSLDIVVPKTQLQEAQTYLYKRPAEVASSVVKPARETSPAITISNPRGQVESIKHAEKFSFISNERPQVKKQSIDALLSPVKENAPRHLFDNNLPTITSEAKLKVQLKSASSMPKHYLSPWEKKQAALITRRNEITTELERKHSQQNVNISPLEIKKPEMFSATLLKKTQLNERQHKVTVNPRTIDRPALTQLENRVQALKATLPQPKIHEVTEVSSRIRAATEIKIGRIDLQPATSQDSTEIAFSRNQARLEITTKIADGVIVTKRMTEVLISKGVEPKLAEEKAIEQTTLTLVKTIKSKGLDKHLVANQAKVDEKKEEVSLDLNEKIVPKLGAQDDIDDGTGELNEIFAVRDHITDAKRVATITAIGSSLLTMAQAAGQSSIDLAAVTEFMPEQPGEDLASYIRTQLRLSLNSEEQYDVFNEKVAKMGEVSSLQEIQEAAIFATDMAPAVMLSQGQIAEKVTPDDERSALRNGNPFKKFVKVIKTAVTEAVQESFRIAA